MSAVLKLVQAQQFLDHVEVDVEATGRNVHSLHSAFSYLALWNPAVVRYLIERFSAEGNLVLDPICSAGTVGVEAATAKRHFIGCSTSAELRKLAQARLSPADIAEVALRLQFVNFKRPVDVRSFVAPLPLFFDVDTFCELSNIRASLRDAANRVDAFVEFIIASILHGHTVGHLSVYTSPYEALTPDGQAAMNIRRGEVPSYRAVGARVLKKAAALLRDGVPAVLQSNQIERSVLAAAPHNIPQISNPQVDLALVCPEQPGFIQHGMRSWLRTWWLGGDKLTALREMSSVEQWHGYTNEILLEMARVVKRGGRTVVRVGSGRLGTKPVSYRDELSQVLSTCLAPYWAVEGTIEERFVKSVGAPKGSVNRSHVGAGELVVLRRR
jgi:SAM-dependent methyltransferase